MHKDPPPGLFDARRRVSHVVSYGAVAGFCIALVAHFGWSLWRQSENTGAIEPVGSEALVNGISRSKPDPNASPAETRH